MKLPDKFLTHGGDTSRDEVILVDAEDRPIGTIEKLEAHRRGLRHRAFSVSSVTTPAASCFNNVRRASTILADCGATRAAVTHVQEKMSRQRPGGGSQRRWVSFAI